MPVPGIHPGPVPWPSVRVVIIAECFLPEVNGVTNSVLRVVEQLERRGHETLVVAPGTGPDRYRATPVERVPAVHLPFYRSLAVGLPTGRLRTVLAGFRPDVVHLAAPVVMGPAGAAAARSLGIPTVAVYQTDLAGFARRYRAGPAAGLVWRWLRRVHTCADLTLAPSTMAAWDLAGHGVGPVAVWGRGVDTDRFKPARRNDRFRRLLAPDGELLVGYVGRLAREKQVDRLAGLQDLPGCRLVVVGDGPERARLQRAMPRASFLGFKSGDELAAAVASMDVFVHTGAHETFCQSIQEALACGVPVVAPASGGPLDLVRHGDNGWLYPAERPDMIRAAVASLASSAETRRAMSSRAVASVQGRSWSALVDQLLGHYAVARGSGGEQTRRAA